MKKPAKFGTNFFRRRDDVMPGSRPLAKTPHDRIRSAGNDAERTIREALEGISIDVEAIVNRPKR